MPETAPRRRPKVVTRRRIRAIRRRTRGIHLLIRTPSRPAAVTRRRRTPAIRRRTPATRRPPSYGYPPPQDGYGQYPGQYPPSAPAGYYDPTAPYGRHPLTGEPYSDKSKTVAGLLQLIGIIGILGVGRMYLGQVGFGIAQLLIGLIGGVVIGLLTCGVGFFIPVVWGAIDAVLIFTDKVRDPQGRPLRDGT